MAIRPGYTSRDLELLPDVEGVRYEIIDGDLYVSKTPVWQHQYASGQLSADLTTWDREAGLGVTLPTPGLVFAPDQDVIPDMVWISKARLALALDRAGHLRIAPELVIEILSRGAANERRDRELKLSLYSRQGVHEYWIVDWRRRRVQVFRREQAALHLAATLEGDDVLTSPLLPGFSCPLPRLWAPEIEPAVLDEDDED